MMKLNMKTSMTIWKEESLQINYSLVKFIREGRYLTDTHKELIMDYIGEDKPTKLVVSNETLERVQKEFAEYMNSKGITVTLEGNAGKYFVNDPYFAKPIPDTN